MQGKILVVGAGPTGLVLALSLAKQKVPFRIIDKKEGPGKASRAMIVMPRTLEFYEQFGFANEIVNDGIKIENVSFHVDGKEKAHLDMGSLGKGVSHFTSPFSYPQDEHERLLLKQLAKYGIAVEWNTELQSIQEMDEGITAKLFNAGRAEKVAFSYVCGCDGADSVVRHWIQTGFQGGTYEEKFYVMDIKAVGAAIDPHKLGMCMAGEEFVILLPVRSTDTTRAIGVIPATFREIEDEVSSDQLVAFMESAFQIHVNEVNWFSTYKVHHRVAEVFRQGRAFLVGDAAHIHSPAGGQGMNTGIGDAVNLGWKLAAVMQGRMKSELLHSFEIERRAFAKRLVKTTDRVFTRVVSKRRVDRFLRKKIVPSFIPLINRSERARKKLFRVLSQVQIEYIQSPVSHGKAGDIQAGKRLPYTGKNYDILGTWDWQVHVYGTVDSKLQHFCENRGLALHSFSYDSITEANGFKKEALYLVRPDGYLGFVSIYQDVRLLQGYLDKWGYGLNRFSIDGDE